MQEEILKEALEGTRHWGSQVASRLSLIGHWRLMLVEVLGAWRAKCRRVRAGLRLGGAMISSGATRLAARVFDVWLRASLIAAWQRSEADGKTACAEMLSRVGHRTSDLSERLLAFEQSRQLAGRLLSLWQLACREARLFRLRTLDKERHDRDVANVTRLVIRGHRCAALTEAFLAWRSARRAAKSHSAVSSAVASWDTKSLARTVFEQWLRVHMICSWYQAQANMEVSAASYATSLRLRGVETAERLMWSHRVLLLGVEVFALWHDAVIGRRFEGFRLWAAQRCRRSYAASKLLSLRGACRLLLCKTLAAWVRAQEQFLSLHNVAAPLFERSAERWCCATVFDAWTQALRENRASAVTSSSLRQQRTRLLSRGALISDRLEMRSQLRLLLLPLFSAWERLSKVGLLPRMVVPLLEAWGPLRALRSTVFGEWRLACVAWQMQRNSEQAFLAFDAQWRSRNEATAMRCLSFWWRRGLLARTIATWHWLVLNRRAQDRLVGAFVIGTARALRHAVFTRWQAALATRQVELDVDAQRHEYLENLFRRGVGLTDWHSRRGLGRANLVHKFGAWRRVQEERRHARVHNLRLVAVDTTSARSRMAADVVRTWTLARAAIDAWARRSLALRALRRHGRLREALVETCVGLWAFTEWRHRAKADMWKRQQQEMASLLAQAGAQLVQVSATQVQQGRVENNARRTMRNVGGKLSHLHWVSGISFSFGAWSRCAAASRWERARERSSGALEDSGKALAKLVRRGATLRDSALQQRITAREARLRLSILAAWRISASRKRWECALEGIRNGQAQGDVTTARRAVGLSARWASREVRRAVVMVWRHAAAQGQLEGVAHRRYNGLRHARAEVSTLRGALVASRVLSGWRLLVATQRGRDRLIGISRRQDAFLLHVAWGTWRFCLLASPAPSAADSQFSMPVLPPPASLPSVQAPVAPPPHQVAYVDTATATTAVTLVASNSARLRPAPPPPTATTVAMHQPSQRFGLSSLMRPSSLSPAATSRVEPVAVPSATSAASVMPGAVRVTAAAATAACSTSSVGAVVSGGGSGGAGGSGIGGSRLGVPYILVGRQPIPPQPQPMPQPAPQMAQVIGTIPADQYVRTTSCSPRLAHSAIAGSSTRPAQGSPSPPRSALATPRSGSCEHTPGRGGSLRVRIGEAETQHFSGSCHLTPMAEEPSSSSSTAVFGRSNSPWSSTKKPGLKFGICTGATLPASSDAARRSSSADRGSWSEGVTQNGSVSARGCGRTYSLGLPVANTRQAGVPCRSGFGASEPVVHTASSAASTTFAAAVQEVWMTSPAAAESVANRKLGADAESALRSWACDAASSETTAAGGAVISSGEEICHPRRLTFSMQDELSSTTMSTVGSWVADAQKSCRGGHPRTPNSARSISPRAATPNSARGNTASAGHFPQNLHRPRFAAF
eukprot:TRINITY_DN18270_c0_g2_i1.p1 TRINITY_DN18270_c0_g2~~TRINITY_DN18270_c0_g2_i1.p1  ORF type:complete len:1506 (+),score=225.66 TRINITY_DN18270_c0_g2_i1:236-4519(+)